MTSYIPMPTSAATLPIDNTATAMIGSLRVLLDRTVREVERGLERYRSAT